MIFTKTFVFFFSSRRRHTRWNCDWSSDVCSSDLSELSKRGHRVTVFFGDMYLDGREHDLGDRLRVVPLPTRLRTPFHPGLVPVTPDLLRHPALREADVIQASEFHQQ